jgi:hypothetical protein
MTTINSPAAAKATAASAFVRERRSRRASYVTMRVLLAVVGVFGVCAASYFGFVLDADDGGIANPFDLFVALWKIGLSLAFLVAAIGPGLGRAGRIALARWALGAEFIFDAIKLGYYHESASLVFIAIDCLLLGLVLHAGRPAKVDVNIRK